MRKRNASKTSGAGRRSFFVRAAAVVIVLCMIAALALPALAAEASEASSSSGDTYSYTVRIFAGDKGTVDGKEVFTKTVRPGYRWNGETTERDFDYNTQAKSSNEKYYVTGIRLSGRDNNTRRQYSGSFLVDSDLDLVVCYGIRGSEVAYTINYLEYGTNAVLHPAETFYGNVGEKPVVSYRYVDGYTPQYYNITGTLQADASKNSWTFYYNRNVEPTTTTTSTSTTTTTTARTSTTTTSRTTTTTRTTTRLTTTTTTARPTTTTTTRITAAGGTIAGGTTPGGTTPGGTTTTPGGTATTPGGTAAGGTTAGTNNATANAGAQAQQNPQEIVDVDNQETPLAQFQNGDNTSTETSTTTTTFSETEGVVRARGMSTTMKVIIGLLVVALLAGAGWFFFRRFASDDEDDDEDEEDDEEI